MSRNFILRHNGASDEQKMLKMTGHKSLNQLIDNTIPADIKKRGLKNLPEPINEAEYIEEITDIASKNKCFDTYIGLGYYGTHTPAVIQRNIFENPSWYTSYTPYQAEISQGRLEALLNFQTMVTELTAMDISNCSLLDEATAAAEAMIMNFNLRNRKDIKEGKNTFLVDNQIFPHTKAVLQTKAVPLNIKLHFCEIATVDFDGTEFGGIVQYPANEGQLVNYTDIVEKLHENGCLFTVIADIMALTLLSPPGEWGADIVVGSTQRFGVPIAYGGPHAAFLACREQYKRHVPGRIIGISKDSQGKPALRMALQTREQHIKRERATSNICTAQALLATMASFYAIYHGKNGLVEIAKEIHFKTIELSGKLSGLGCKIEHPHYFDTIKVNIQQADIKKLKQIAIDNSINFRYFDDNSVGISIDETTSIKKLNNIVSVFSLAMNKKTTPISQLSAQIHIPNNLKRKAEFFSQKIFHDYQTETRLMRYMKKLERRDIALDHSMIALGSCTMKLNSASLMAPVSLPGFTHIHPFVPTGQSNGYKQIIGELESFLSEISGLPGCTLQPNSGASGEYTGILVIKAYFKSIGQENRNIILIPASAHGTNPASAVMAGCKVVVVKCDGNGNIDNNYLDELCDKYSESICAIMITYPSTHGVFEDNILEITQRVHKTGAQVYLDGANMNAQVGYTNPAVIGADVCHLNLHKTFAIPHGGGGPGIGPICVAKHLTEFLPGHPFSHCGGKNGISPVASAPWGSAGILSISYGYIKLLGAEGLRSVTAKAILNANYLAASLEKIGYSILYKGAQNTVGHEFILDCRSFKHDVHITEVDIAKRLMDYGFHAPTVSFPVPGTLMIEPTESESIDELDRFIMAMDSILSEINDVKNGKIQVEESPLKHAPHTAQMIAHDDWPYKYSRQEATFPLEWIADNKFWPSVSRIDDAFGDRNLMCTCTPIENYMETGEL